MLDATGEDRGTVQSSAADATVDDSMCFGFLGFSLLNLHHFHVELGPIIPGSHSISEVVQSALLQYYNSGDIQKVHHFLARVPSAGSCLLKPTATRFYRDTLLDGQYITLICVRCL